MASSWGPLGTSTGREKKEITMALESVSREDLRRGPRVVSGRLHRRTKLFEDLYVIEF